MARETHNTIKKQVGIVGYGPYIPRFRVSLESIASHWGYDRAERPIPLQEKSVAGADEDTITMSIEAARNALHHAGVGTGQVGAVWVGTESKPYSVKPCAITVAEAIGATPYVAAADIEFACKAGTEALRIAAAHVTAGMSEFALAIGMDTAQARPGDELELTAGAGGAAFLVGPSDDAIAILEAFTSYATDTPDFFRRNTSTYPEHGRRFTAAPAYFEHTIHAGKRLLEQLGAARAEDFAYAVFHYPTPSFPRQAAKLLGFHEEQLRPGLVGDRIGNCYAGSTLLGLAAIIDIAKPGDRIFCASYGSGAGSDAFSLRVTDLIHERRQHSRFVSDYVERRTPITDYAKYLRLTGHLAEGRR